MNPPHIFSLLTRRCLRCNLHEFHVAAVPRCTASVEGERRVEEDGIIIVGPES